MSEATVDVADLRHHGGVEEDAADAPLREDLRLLGRVLGEIIREQSGEDVPAVVESTRVETFRLRHSEVDRADVAARLGALDVRSADHVIRAFNHFSVLANLAEDLHHERRRRTITRVQRRHQRSCRMLLAVTGDDRLLADNPSLARSIRNRFPYLEPPHHLQVEMLRRRRGGDDDELVRRNIQLTITGIATGARNSG